MDACKMIDAYWVRGALLLVAPNGAMAEIECPATEALDTVTALQYKYIVAIRYHGPAGNNLAMIDEAYSSRLK
jgi:hypothetical protein